MAVIRGKSIYAQVHKPNPYGFYSITLAIDENTAKKLEVEGLKAKDSRTLIFKDGSTAEQFGPKIVKIKQRLTNINGENNPAPQVVDSDLQPFNKEIGNGSTVDVQFRIGEWSFNNKKGKAAYLQAVQVRDWVEYKKPLEFEKVDAEEIPF